MFLSVVILGRFTTETHAMAHSITADTPDRYLHHIRGRTHPGGVLHPFRPPQDWEIVPRLGHRPRRSERW